jgi:cell division protease FtsH
VINLKDRRLLNLIPYVIVIIAVMSVFQLSLAQGKRTLNYQEFMKIVEQQDITEINLSFSTTVIDISGKFLESGKEVDFTAKVPNNELATTELLSKLDGVEKTVIQNTYEKNYFLEMIVQIVPYILIFGVALFFLSRMNGGGNNKAFEFGKSRAKIEGDIKVRFNDVAGCDEEKEEMAELIEYLRNPKRFTKMGARIPKGVLLVGAPGTGKTLLAKAVAGEADVPFYSISGSDFVEMFVGVGASRVRDMFKKAQQTSPCIVFIDEIDAVGRQRGTGLGGGHDEREQTLNQLLVEMDGINDNSGIVMIAATNRPDVLDPALLRPGRFDRQITVSLPDKKGREAILKVHARNKLLGNDIDLGAIAKRTQGFSGAELENVLNEAAIMAVRASKTEINMPEFDEAIDRVMAGPAKKSRTYTEQEKRLVAYHEVGHALVGLINERANDIQKITIIPRGQAGGYTLFTPKEEKMLRTRSDLLASITSYLGGRVAEEEVFNEISTGAYSDIQEATRIAREMVMSYGMSELGPIQYDSGSGAVFLGRDYNNTRMYSNITAAEIDRVVREIIDGEYQKCRTILQDHRELLDLLAAKLLEQETLVYEEIQEIYQQYQNNKKDTQA